jgi:hypothetical protein
MCWVVGAANPRKAFFQIATLEKGGHRLLDDRSPEGLAGRGQAHPECVSPRHLAVLQRYQHEMCNILARGFHVMLDSCQRRGANRLPETD